MKCRICGGSAERKIETQDFMITSQERFIYRVCKDCGSWLLENIPEDIGKYYQTDYYSYNNTETADGIAIARKIAHSMIKTFKFTETTSFLDYGGGNITLLKGLYREGVGIDGELHKLRCYDKYAPPDDWNGIKLQNTLPTDMKFDFILSKHCLEHELDPNTQIKNILDLLTADGRGHFVVPNPDSINAEHFQGNWIGIDGPRHINLLTQRAVKKLIKANGGEVIEQTTMADYTNFLTSEMYSKGGVWEGRSEMLTKVSDERINQLWGFSMTTAEMGKADMFNTTFKKSTGGAK